MSMKTKYAKYFVFVVGLFLFDQLLKFVFAKLSIGREVSFGFIKIGLFQNYNGLFGLVGISEIIIVSLAILGLLVALFWESVNERERIALLLIFLGGLINFVDRIKLGYVRDNFAIGNLGYFNFADVLIGVGIFVLVLGIFQKNISIINKIISLPLGKRGKRCHNSSLYSKGGGEGL